MWLDAVVAQDVRNEVILGGVGLFTHPALPTLLVPTNIHIVAVVHVNIDTEFLIVGCSTSRNCVMSGLIRVEVFFGAERTRGEVYYRPGHEKGVWKKAVGERREIRRMEEKRGGGPNRRRTKRLLLHLHRQSHTWRPVM